MPKHKNSAKNTAKRVFYFTLGLFAFLLCCVFICLSVPFVCYRWCITSLIVPYFFRKKLGNIVDVLGTLPATEFLSPRKTTPRDYILANLTLDKALTYDALYQRINEQWICAKDSSGKLKYPEFTQYIESWMGYMFWKPEANFCLKSHIKCYSIPRAKDSESCLNQLNEKNLNTPTAAKTSPWEVHLVEVYDNADLHTSGCIKSKSYMILRMHHAMADGVSILHLLVEQFCGTSFETAMKTLLPKLKLNHEIGPTFSPIKFFIALGRAICLIVAQQNITCNIASDDKSSHQFCQRTKPISVEKVKQIKNTFGVSFMAVQCSAFAAALGRTEMKIQNKNKNLTEFPVTCGLPVPNHEKKLTNQMLGAVYGIPVDSDMSVRDRLEACQKAIEREHNPQVLAFTHFISKILFLLPVRLARKFFRHNSMSILTSTLPGPEIMLGFNGSHAVAVDYAVGSWPIGNGAVTFSSFSYENALSIVVTAKSAVISKSEMELMVRLIENEIDLLHALVTRGD